VILPGQGEAVSNAYNYGFMLAVEKFEIIIFAVFTGLLLNQVAQISLNRGWVEASREKEMAETVRDAGLQMAWVLSIWLVVTSQIFGKALRVTAG